MSILNEIATDVHEAGGSLYYVGGYVRNELLNIPTNDIDIECFGLQQSRFEAILKKYGHVETIGKEFGIYKLLSLPEVDFALPRSEKKIGQKHTDFEVSIDPYLTLESAARRRDFTCNALYKSVRTGKIFDPFDGLKDLENKTLKHIDDQTFIEDSLRGLRACQFAARMNMTIHPDTQLIIQTMEYNHLSKERIFEEVRKGLESPHPDVFIHWLFTLKITPKLFKDLITISPEDRLALENILKNVTLPLELSIIFGIITFFTSNQSSLLDELTNNKRTIAEAKKTVTFLVQIHLADSNRKLRKLKQLVYDVPTTVNILQAFDQANMPLHQPLFIDIATFLRKYKAANENNLSKEPLVMGKDLILLGYSPGPNFSKLLSQAYELELDGFTKKEIISKIKRS